MIINILSGTSQLAQKAIAHLLDRGFSPDSILITTRHPEKNIFHDKGIRTVFGDYDSRESLVSAFKRCNKTWLIPSFAPDAQRVAQITNGIEASVKAGIQHVYFSSFITVHPDSAFQAIPFYLYAETRLKQCGLKWTILRNGVYLDPLVEWIAELANKGYFSYPVKEGRVAYISRNDLGRATAAALLSDDVGGRIFELTGPEALSMYEIGEIAASKMNKEFVYQPVSEEKFKENCRKDKTPEPEIELLTSMYRAVENGETDKVSRDVFDLTGFQATSVGEYFEQVLVPLVRERNIRL
ncbi:MAG: NmrA family NAD(P)-binding protein [Bacteroidota bacterium]